MKLTLKDIEERDLVCCYCGKRDGITEAVDNGDDNVFTIHCGDYATLIPRREWDEEMDDLEESVAAEEQVEQLAEGPCSCGGPHGGDHLGFCCIWQS